MASHKSYLAKFNRLVLPTVSKLERLLTSNLEPELKNHELTLAEFRIVGLLMGEEKGYSQKQLAQKLNISAPSLSVSLVNLEKKHWIQRITDEEDQRIKRIQVSPIADFSAIAKLITSLESKATKGINQEDLTTTHAVLQKIILNITT